MNTSTPQRQSNPQESSSPEDECPVMQPWEDLVNYARTYARKEPEVAACICLGIGFILGWRLKPW